MASPYTQWLPYLGDAVAVRAGDQDLTGTTTRYDSSVVEFVGATALEVGQVVGAAWRVGTEVHRGGGTVIEVSATAFSVKLAPAPAETSRRSHERLAISLPLVVCPSQHGSFGAVPRQARSLDVSNGGLRAIIDADTGFGIGEVLRVEVEIGGRVEVLLASVVWETAHGAGERLAGLRFKDEVRVDSWLALAHAGT